jgi:CBS domain-containing protein
MPSEALQLLATSMPFARLPPEVRAEISAQLSLMGFPRGSMLAVQGRTTLEHLAILKSGELELYFERHGRRSLQGKLGRGAVFGGISILWNAGLAIRSVRVAADAEVYRLPRQAFLDLCRRYAWFRDYFTAAFAERMQNDSYAEAIAAPQIVGFFARIPPFSFLPEEELQEQAHRISARFYPRDTVIFVQGESRVDGLMVIRSGAAERYFEAGGRKTLHSVLGEGDIFGGISMLVNDMLAVRTLRTVEDTQFYRVPHELFFDWCRRYEVFSEFFTDAFGKRMLDRSYAAVIAKSVKRQPDELPFFNQPVADICSRNLLVCSAAASIREAAAMMSERRCSSIFVRGADGRIQGVVTDNDLRSRVVVQGRGVEQPVGTIMSTPLIGVAEETLISEALMTMMRSNVKHLAVTGARGEVTGVVTHHDIAAAQGDSPLFLVQEIAKAAGVPEIQALQRRLPAMVQRLLAAGTPAKHTNRFISAVSDAVLEKVVALALRDMAPPPARFAVMVLGSEGRKEQTLKTDQDNAIVFEDVEAGRLEAVHAYFLALGERVCDALHACGYRFCQADVMARNPKLCQPLAVWKRRFSEWIHTAEADDLLYASIFFDFRAGCGNPELIHALRVHLTAELEGWSGFFRHLAQNALLAKPPLGFFRNFVVESKGEQRNKFDVKHAMMPIVDHARLYALKHGIEETNTLARLHRLKEREVLPPREVSEVEQGYGFLMQLRLARQVAAIQDEKREPDNYINPRELSGIEQRLLKEIFLRIGSLQTRMSFDFTGEP